MIQEIITYIIISLASAYTAYNFYRLIVGSKNKAKKHSCSGGCSACSLNQIIHENRKTFH